MSSWSPTVEGFRALFRRPALPLAEIAWRWSFGGAGVFLVLLGLFEYLNSLPVSRADRLLLRSGHPMLISRALSEILRGSAVTFVVAGTWLGAGLGLLWILLASVGRASILASLLEYMHWRVEQFAAPVDLESRSFRTPEERNAPWRRSILGLNFLRAVLGFATVLSVGCAAMLSSSLSSPTDPHPGLAFIGFACLLIVIGCLWLVLNWFLSLATIFAARDPIDTFQALGSAIGLVREKFGAVVAVGIWFGIAHITVLVVMTSAVGFPLSLATIVPPGFVLAGILLITLAYFALADSLYIGRLAGYVALLEAPPVSAVSSPGVLLGVPPGFVNSPAQSAVAPSAQDARVDTAELILSDRSRADWNTQVEPNAIHQREAQAEMRAPASVTHHEGMVDQNERILSDESDIENES